MRQAEEIWFAHQRKRFMRPDAQRYMQPQRYQPPGHLAAKGQNDHALIEPTGASCWHSRRHWPN
jgi:hypothetical protein